MECVFTARHPEETDACAGIGLLTDSDCIDIIREGMGVHAEDPEDKETIVEGSGINEDEAWWAQARNRRTITKI